MAEETKQLTPEEQILALNAENDKLRKQVTKLEKELSKASSVIDFSNILPAQEAMLDDQGKPTTRTFGSKTVPADGAWSHAESISFAHDAGYSLDSIKGRAIAITQRAFEQSHLGNLDRGGHQVFDLLPPFAPERKLNVLVWID